MQAPRSQRICQDLRQGEKGEDDFISEAAAQAFACGIRAKEVPFLWMQVPMCEWCT